ncbi:MAG: tyrosine-type recombinase/integrase [Cyanobacteria bacterium J06555_13]
MVDESGKLWHFQTHQFRHTLGTRMINNGVPRHIIQR